MDLRVYALSRASQNILANLGAWESIAETRASPYRLMRVWHGERVADDGEFNSRGPEVGKRGSTGAATGDLARRRVGAGALTFDSADIGEPDLGHIVEDVLCRDRLCGALRRSSVRLAFGAKIESVEIGERHVRVSTGDGETVDATVLIAADGSDSAIRQRLEFPVTEFSYGQRAVVAHVATGRSHRETAWQRFLPDGPVAFLPLLDGRSSVVWSTGSEHAEALSRAGEPQFIGELQAASAGAAGAHPVRLAARELPPSGPSTPTAIAFPAWRWWATPHTPCTRWPAKA